MVCNEMFIFIRAKHFFDEYKFILAFIHLFILNFIHQHKLFHTVAFIPLFFSFLNKLV